MRFLSLRRTLTLFSLPGPDPRPVSEAPSPSGVEEEGVVEGGGWENGEGGREESGGGGMEDCLYCNQTFRGRPEQLAAHLAQHSQYLDVRCDLCGTNFSREADLAAHSEECGSRQLVIVGAVGEDCPERRQQHVCQVCRKVFKTASRLKVHSGEKESLNKISRYGTAIHCLLEIVIYLWIPLTVPHLFFSCLYKFVKE